MPKDSDSSDTTDVFISYKREERQFAVQVGRALNNAGYSFVTDIDLENDTHFADAVDKRLRKSRVVLVLWTKAAAKSDWVRLEARHGVQQNRYIGIELEPLGDALPFDLAGLNRDVVAQGRPLSALLPEIVAAVTKRLGQDGAPIREASEAALDFTADNMAFETAERVDTREAYQEYLRRFPNGFMAKEAARRARKAGTLGYWLSKNLLNATAMATLIAALGLGYTLLKDRQTNGGLNATEEAQLQRDLRTLRDELATLADNPTPEDLAHLQAQIEETEATLKQVQNEINAKNAEIEDLTGQLRASRAAQATLADKLDTANTENSRALEQLKAIKAANLPKPDCPIGATVKTGFLFPDDEGKSQQCVDQNASELNLYRSGMTNQDMPKLAGLTALRSLSLTYTQVNDISALKGLTALQTLSLYNTQVSDISALKGLTALRSLSLFYTQVSDISALKGLTALEDLWLPNGTKITGKAEVAAYIAAHSN